jgi:hypothetical protein
MTSSFRWCVLPFLAPTREACDHIPTNNLPLGQRVDAQEVGDVDLSQASQAVRDGQLTVPERFLCFSCRKSHQITGKSNNLTSIAVV